MPRDAEFYRMLRPERLGRDQPVSLVPAWDRPDMRKALADRNVAVVFRILQRFGVSQRRIASATAQSQSEISEILAGRRVTSYDVLLRIADGLAVPRGRMGLAYDDNTADLFGLSRMPALGLESGEAPLWLIYDSLSAS